jgi:branched-subunit amino acid transport protein
VQNLLIFREGQFPILKVKETIACIPALLVGYYTKDLMKIVITGVIAMALLRFFL